MISAAQPQRLRPAALRSGDTVGMIAPAGPIRSETLEAGCASLLRRGYEPFYLPSILDRDWYFAGSLDRRLSEFHEVFSRPEVKGIVCVRGGYGSNYLLPHLDLNLIRQNPKVFCGCSDVTALLTYLCDAAGMVVFHGPMLDKDARLDGIDEESWFAAVSSGAAYGRKFDAEEVRPLREGAAAGMLYGGCLSLLVASLGTPYEINPSGCILFLEDIGEPAYRLDRMLRQLKLAGKFDQVRGVIFGEMLDCGRQGAMEFTLEHVAMRVLDDFDGPIAFGLKSGHVSSGNITLPLGVKAELSVGASVSLSIEAAVTVAPVNSAVRKA